MTAKSRPSVEKIVKILERHFPEPALDMSQPLAPEIVSVLRARHRGYQSDARALYNAETDHTDRVGSAKDRERLKEIRYHLSCAMQAISDLDSTLLTLQKIKIRSITRDKTESIPIKNDNSLTEHLSYLRLNPKFSAVDWHLYFDALEAISMIEKSFLEVQVAEELFEDKGSGNLRAQALMQVCERIFKARTGKEAPQIRSGRAPSQGFHLFAHEVLKAFGEDTQVASAQRAMRKKCQQG